MQKTEAKKNWTITSDAFHRLLEWLDEGENSDGHKYLEMRERLITFFDRKNCLTPEDLSDETLNRVARRLEEVGGIEAETPQRYCYITARFVFMEYLRGKKMNKIPVPLDDVLQKRQANLPDVSETDREKKILKEKMLGCLEQCAEKLETANREIIFNYYYGEERIKIENRRALAEKLQISINALSIRACRIRDKLEGCVSRCVGKN